MQVESTDLFTPNVLETPSLMTPDIVFNSSATTTTTTTTYDPLHNQPDSLSMSNSSTTTTTINELSSADIKLSKIEDELKQSLTEPRKPTPSPFQKISNGVFNLEIRTNPIVTTEDGSTIEIPSTADVVKEIEAITNISANQFEMKTLITDRETIINGDNNRLGSFQNLTKTANVSPPKKSFLHRSQSHTEPTSPQPNSSQSQKINENNTNAFDDEGLIDHQFSRVSDVPTIVQTNDFKAIHDNGNEQIIKQQQQQIILNNKRTFAASVSPLAKTTTLIIPPPANSEVTSTFPVSKRTRTAPVIPTNTTVMNFHSVPTTTTTTMPTYNSNGTNVASDDHRKKLIRDSNREAARRCRERRRQYIETLEGNLEHHKLKIKQLEDKLTRIERENTQLRAILSESKILHTTRLNINDSHLDYGNVLNASAIEINSDSTDGTTTIQRSYVSRNNL